MDSLLTHICSALKKIITQLNPQINALSFLIVTGDSDQGKSGYLNQSTLKYYFLDNDSNVKLFYNDHGIVLELGKNWLNQNEQLLTQSLKQLNRCHRLVKITGFVLCVDSSALLQDLLAPEYCYQHAHLLNRFGQALNYPVDLAIVLTKLDLLVGFCDFFQSAHHQDLLNPLGFSLEIHRPTNKLLNNYNTKFEQLIEHLCEQIINKLHPARSNIKRTLIREFPLQFASLKIPIQLIIQKLSLPLFNLQALYFTSAEQGGIGTDYINKKIQHDYALSIQNQRFQSHNYQAFFIVNSLLSFQIQTKYHLRLNGAQRRARQLGGVVVSLILASIAVHYYHTTVILNKTQQALSNFSVLAPGDNTQALYHLALAETNLALLSSSTFIPVTLKTLRSTIKTSSQQYFHDNFLPQLISGLETVVINPSQTALMRYHALKIYLMLGNKQYYDKNQVTQWFQENTNQYRHISAANYHLLLTQTFKAPFEPINTNQQIIRDTRNYLNALPVSYLYYALAKPIFTKKTIALNDMLGFDLATVNLPLYLTKAGFNRTLNQLPMIAKKLQQENWVLARQDLTTLAVQLEAAYCSDYLTFWQNFIRRTRPQHYQGYQQARLLVKTLQSSQTITRLIALIQQQTQPELKGHHASLFNQAIAKQFTALNLITASTARKLNQSILDLEHFFTTLALANDDGQTVFQLTRSRFQNDKLSDPLSLLYSRANQLPQPFSSWAKQIADDTWFIFISQSKQYINEQWQHSIFSFYQNHIAHRYPVDSLQKQDIALTDFNRFFSPLGTLNVFANLYIKPFLDLSQAQWQPKELNGYILPVSSDLINELIRANVISSMFFPNNTAKSSIEFSLQKIDLDSAVASLQLAIGKTMLTDNQHSDSYTFFKWPEKNAKLSLISAEGRHFELTETGLWAFFKMLQKVNVLVDSNDSASLQILFEVNGNVGRYLLKTKNQINPFSPGILTGFNLTKTIA